MFPGNPEICDGLDNDCDDVIDDGLLQTFFWPDTDGDGFGDSDAELVEACAAPPGHADNATDCDDTDPDVNPDAEEVPCDGVDNDCDAATVDELDADGDGVSACTDCNDSEPAAYPGAEEICDDGVDNDCDGDRDTADEDCAAENPNDDGGCGCRGTTGTGDPLLILLAFGWLAWPGRRRRTLFRGGC